MQITTTTTQTVELDPELALKLELTASNIVGLQAEAKAIEQAIDTDKATIEALLTEAGVDKVIVGEYRCTMVRPNSSRMSQASLLAAGVSAAQIARAKIPKPGKPYPLVALASDKEVIDAASE